MRKQTMKSYTNLCFQLFSFHPLFLVTGTAKSRKGHCSKQQEKELLITYDQRHFLTLFPLLLTNRQFLNTE